MPKTNPQASSPHEAKTDVKGRYFVLFMLILVYTLNFLDRQIISILKDPIATELNLDDAQLGLMGGLAFAFLYSILAIPVAWLADRFSRVWIITISVAVWSAFTAFCGLATNFYQLAFARMGVGVGEAGGVAPSYSLVADYFPPKQRSLALAIFSFGIPIGSAAGFLFGGLLAKEVGWRNAFFIMGGVGLLLAPILRLVIKDPVRGFYDKSVAQDQIVKPLGLIGAAKVCFVKPSFWYLSLGAASSSMVGYGLLYWMPTFLARSLHMDIVSRSYFLAALLLISGIIGMSLGGVLADYFGKKSKSAYALIPAFAFLLSVPLFYLGVTAKTPTEAFLYFLVPQAFALMWLGPVLSAVQHLGPANSRSMISSLFLLINNLLGIALGTYGFGAISKWLKPIYGEDSIKYAFIYGLGFYFIAAGLMFLASRQLKKDWVE